MVANNSAGENTIPASSIQPGPQLNVFPPNTTPPGPQRADVNPKRGIGSRRSSQRSSGMSRNSSAGTSPGDVRQRKKPVSWRKDCNSQGQCSLDAIVAWLTTDNNYKAWRGGSKSKKEITEIIVKYLANKGFPDRPAKGVYQQIQALEDSYQKARDWRDQTGQGILDEADQLKEGMENDSEGEQIVVEAKNKTKAEIKKRCAYFYDLDPILGDRLSAAPMSEMDSTSMGDEMEALRVLNLSSDRTDSDDSPDSPDEDLGKEIPWPNSPERRLSQESTDISNMSSSSMSCLSLPQPSQYRMRGQETLDDSNSAQGMNVDQTPRNKQMRTNRGVMPAHEEKTPMSKRKTKKNEKNFMVQFAEDFLPNKNKRAEAHKHNVEMEAHHMMVGAKVAEAASSLSQNICGLKKSNPEMEAKEVEMRNLEIKQANLEIRKRKCEVATMELQKQRLGAHEQAKMIKDLIWSGLYYQMQARSRLRS